MSLPGECECTHDKSMHSFACDECRVKGCACRKFEHASELDQLRAENERLKAEWDKLGESFAAECETTHQLRAQVEALTRERAGLRAAIKKHCLGATMPTVYDKELWDAAADIGEGD